MGLDTEHGDRSRPVAATLSHPYTRLTPDRVIDAVESTGRRCDARILALNSYENRVYQVGIEDGEPLIAKFYRPARWTTAQIDEEHRFTRMLYEQELPVVPPLELDANAECATLAEYDGFQFALFPRQGGRAPELDNLDHLHQLARFIGRIHAAGRAFRFEHRDRLETSQARVNVEYLVEAGFIPSELDAPYRAISAEVLALVEQRPPDDPKYAQISLHGDCHGGNLLWRDERPHFVDFDDCLSGPAIQDLWMLLSGDYQDRQRQLLEIVEGYEMFCEFDLAQLELIETLRAMRVLRFNAWLARRWDDPAFPQAFPWFNSPRYWSDYILELKEMLSAMQQPSLIMPLV